MDLLNFVFESIKTVDDMKDRVVDKFDFIKNYRLKRNSFIDNVFRDPVVPDIGTVIMCDLSPVPGLSLFDANAEHTGIYAGNDTVIHRDGDGHIQRVTPKEFINRLEGLNWALTVYVACHGEKSLRIPRAYDRSRRALDDPAHEGYSLVNKNCHQFTTWCLTGKETGHGLDYSFTSLQILLKNRFQLDCWRVWNYD